MRGAETCTQPRRRSAARDSGRGIGSRPWLGLLLVVGLAMSLGPTVPCRAGGLVIELPTLTNVAPGSSGSFDVLLVDTDPLGSMMTYNVAEDNFELKLTGAAGFTFTNATINTSASYIYVQSTDGFLGSPLSLNSFPNTDFTASDEEFASPYYRTLTPQAVFALASVSYSVASTASGTAMLTIVDANTGLTELDGITSIPYTVMNGSISTASTPEPSTLILATTPLVIGLCEPGGATAGAGERRSMTPGTYAWSQR